jgi:hypothetical protein
MYYIYIKYCNNMYNSIFCNKMYNIIYIHSIYIYVHINTYIYLYFIDIFCFIPTRYSVCNVHIIQTIGRTCCCQPV